MGVDGIVVTSVVTVDIVVKVVVVVAVVLWLVVVVLVSIVVVVVFDVVVVDGIVDVAFALKELNQKGSLNLNIPNKIQRCKYLQFENKSGNWDCRDNPFDNLLTILLLISRKILNLLVINLLIHILMRIFQILAEWC